MQQKTGPSSASAQADNANLRRPMSSYGLTPFATAPPPPLQQAYLGSLGNSGMPMNMSAIRSFAPLNHHHHQQQQQQQQQQHQQPSQTTAEPSTASFWRSSDQSQHHHAQHLHAYKPNGLDMEFNDFLSGAAPNSCESHASAMAHSSLHTVDDTTGDDVGMGEVATTFQLPSSFTSASSVPPLSLAHASLQQNRHLSTTLSSRSASPNSDGSSTPSNSAAMATSVARPAAPVVTTTTTPSGQSPSDYSRFVDSMDEPDLSQHKIEQKNEKCQFHNCPNRARVSQAYGKFCNRHVIVAPCGFPGCRDKALLHSSMCDKHLAEGKDALHRILANRAQNVPVCRTFGCFKNDQGRGYCRGHEKLLMATGRLPKHINKRRLNSAYTMCSYPNCNKHSQRNHLCRTHGNVVLKQAEDIVKNANTGESFEDVLARLQKEIRRCTHPTCTKNSQRDRLCTMHYYEKHNLQRDAGSRDTDSQLSSTDGGGESDLETAVCSIDGCNLHAFSKRGLCKFHSGELTHSSASGTPTSKSSQDGSSGRHRPLCSIQGCGKIAPYASGLCAHHGNKTNQAIQITRMAPPTSVSSGASVCGVQACTSNALPGNAFCEYHTTQRRLQAGGDSAATRPSLGEAGGYSNQGSQSFMGATSPDPTGVFAFDGFANLATGTTGRMASMSVSTSATVAENDARQALVTLNSSSRPGASTADGDRSTQSFLSAPSTCSNPMCSRECCGRDYCDSCLSIFSPLVVSVGDSTNGNPYQLSSLNNNTSTNQSLQPEPEGDAMWDASSESKSKSKDLCRANECGAPVARFGLCDAHVRLFQSGSLSVDEITLRSRQIREEKEREAALDAALAAGMKQAANPQVKKYFCKFEGCDKQVQKRGLCKRHFRMHEMSASGKPEGSSFEDSNQQLDTEVHSPQHFCQFLGCGENVNLPVTLCPSHSAASFCWAAGCETLVESPQFCDYHVYRRECGFEGCTFTALADSSGCANHIMERKCSHDHCEHYAVPRSVRCRLHLDDCTQQPCALCDLYGVSGRGSIYAMRGSDGKPTMAYAHQGASNNNNNSIEFANERELARRSAFHDGRRL